MILPIDLASANAWFHDPDLRTTAEHMALHRELVEAGIVAWLRDTRLIEHVIALNTLSHCPECQVEVGTADMVAEAVVEWLTGAMKAGEHIREAL